MSPDSASALVAAITEIREDDALTIVDDMLAAGADPTAVIESCREAMAIIGSRFESGRGLHPGVDHGG